LTILAGDPFRFINTLLISWKVFFGWDLGLASSTFCTPIIALSTVSIVRHSRYRPATSSEYLVDDDWGNILSINRCLSTLHCVKYSRSGDERKRLMRYTFLQVQRANIVHLAPVPKPWIFLEWTGPKKSPSIFPNLTFPRNFCWAMDFRRETRNSKLPRFGDREDTHWRIMGDSYYCVRKMVTRRRILSHRAIPRGRGLCFGVCLQGWKKIPL